MKETHWITEVTAVQNSHTGSRFACSTLYSFHYGRAPYATISFLFQIINSFPFTMQKRSNTNQDVKNYILDQNKPVEPMTGWKFLNWTAFTGVSSFSGMRKFMGMCWFWWNLPIQNWFWVSYYESGMLHFAFWQNKAFWWCLRVFLIETSVWYIFILLCNIRHI